MPKNFLTKSLIGAAAGDSLGIKCVRKIHFTAVGTAVKLAVAAPPQKASSQSRNQHIVMMKGYCTYTFNWKLNGFISIKINDYYNTFVFTNVIFNRIIQIN